MNVHSFIPSRERPESRGQCPVNHAILLLDSVLHMPDILHKAPQPREAARGAIFCGLLKKDTVQCLMSVDYAAIRKANMALYHGLYANLAVVNPSDRWKCFYCGQEGGTVDHQPPISTIGSMVTGGMAFECVLVPSCSHCNQLLGNLPTITLSERFEELKNRLRTKYHKELQIQGQWTMEEILELGHSLRGMILGSVQLGQLAEERILYPGHRIKPDPERWQDGLMHECVECGAVLHGPVCPSCYT